MEREKRKKEVEQLFTDPEPWEAWEGKFVVVSIITGIVSMIILGILINWLIL